MTTIDQFAAYAGLDRADKKHDVSVQFRNGELFKSLPGTGPRILSALGDNRERFNSVENTKLRWHCTSNRMKLSKIPGTLALAMCEVRPTNIRGMGCEDGKVLILGQTVLSEPERKGKSHQSTIRALAFKWVRIIYRFWKTRTRYDESKYLLAPEARKSPLLMPYIDK